MSYIGPTIQQKTLFLGPQFFKKTPVLAYVQYFFMGLPPPLPATHYVVYVQHTNDESL